jgi:MEDS: MEthanogen/methylotroph, DcmR Sensory domain
VKNAAIPISLAGSQLGEARHVCAFFHSREGEYRVTLPFVKDGLECGHKALHIVDPARRADHLRRMTSGGIDPAAAQQNGQFELHDWNDTFFRDGPFNPDRQLALLETVLEGSRQQGFPLSRYVAHAEWALEKGASLDLLLEFEARVNHIWPRSADTVICTYDLARFGGEIVVDAMRTHPVVIIGGVLQQNPFFVQPDEFLRDLRERQAARTAPVPTAT